MELEGHSSVSWPENMGTKPTAAGSRAGVAPILSRQRAQVLSQAAPAGRQKRAKLSRKT